MLTQKFKEYKKIMNEQLEADKQAIERLIRLSEIRTDKIIDTFIENLREEIKTSTKVDLLTFLKAKDEEINEDDKMAVASLFAIEHDLEIEILEKEI